MHKRFFAALLFSCAAGPALAQLAPSEVEPGTRVRVSIPAESRGRSGHWIVGTLLSLDSVRLAMRPQGESQDAELTAPLDAVEWLEVSGGAIEAPAARRTGALRGAAVGAVVSSGLLGFGKLVGARGSGCERDPLCEVFSPTLENAVRNGAIAAATGGVIGYFLGGRSRERWVPVRLHVAQLEVDGRAIALRLPVGN